MTVLHLDDTDFDKAVSFSSEPVLVDFSATWCGPCKVLEPILERMAASAGGRFRIAKVDIDDAPETARRFGVRGAPTLVVLRQGKEIARHLGVASEARIRELLSS
ncbi:MAG: thioredoxin [Deltaproteobacteria bacterium]|nr:thioredoxin [Deltaproteobacteria bacterium]